MKTALVAEARDALGRVNTNAFDHDLLFQYRGGVLGRELTLIVRDLADALEAAGAERDAALAAIERVRALHHETYANTSDEAWKRNQICAHCGYVFPCDTRAALDGAPEPEWEQIDKVAAERDAATAAIERVRAVVKSIRFLAALPPFDEGNTVMNAAADDIVVAIDGAPEPDTITIPRPVVPFGPVSKTENEATADYLLEVVKKINGKYCTVGGSNVTATVRKLLVDAADAVRGLPVEGEGK